MSTIFRASIAVKIALLVLGGTLLVFALVLSYSYTYSRTIIRGEAEESASNLALAVARRIEQEFRAVAKIPEGLSCVLETTDLDEESLVGLIGSLVEQNPEVFGCAVAFEPYAFKPSVEFFCPYICKTQEGVRLTQLAPPAYNYPQLDWYHIPKVKKTPVWSHPYFDEGGGNILMTTFSVPFFARSDKGARRQVRGVITADVSLEWLTKLVSSIRVGKSGYCFIISDTGTFITHPRKEFITRESIFSLAEQYNEPRWRTIGRTMIRRQSGFVEARSLITGADSFFAFARIPSTRWALAAVFPQSELFSEVARLHQITVMVAFAGVLMLLLVSLMVARSIARPLRRMADAAEKVAQGDLDLDLSDIRRRDEVGRLAESFMHMTEGLKDREFIRDTFGRYLTREVVNRLLESKDGLRLGGESREISMLMSDLRGFTALTAQMPPESVIAFLNRYLGKMLEILLDHRGQIDEIIGDGILAFFGAPETLEDHPARAVACALKMQAAMDEINALNERDGFPHLEMGVAVNTGDVVVGNIGSERRSKYGAVGSQVNFTGRVESFTVGGQVLISHATYQRIADLVSVRNVIEVEMKGVPGKVSLYDVSGIGGSFAVDLPRRDDTPQPLKERIEVAVYLLDQKIVAGTGIQAWVTHFSPTSIRLVVADRIRQWEDVRISATDTASKPGGGTIFGKVTAVSQAGDYCEAVVRCTSIPPEVYKMFRAAVISREGLQRD
ncbi:MAG: HAMP domain-containing protein [Desulfomonile tiedjei]|nr:HAMP domain-containing protein [Desulfomonile tiedjei]